MITQELINIRKKWYSKKVVYFNLLRAMRDREVIFMSKSNNAYCIRGLKINFHKYLFDCFKIYNFFERDYNIYVSVAKYNNIPTFTHRLKNRSKETSKWFKEQASLSMIDYDLFIDFDITEFKEIPLIKQQAFRLYEILCKEDIIFNCYPSGSGIQFNIKIDYNAIPLDKIKPITELFKERFMLENLDLKGVGSQSKIRKCEYSLVEDRAIIPFKNSKEILKYNPKKYVYSEILKNVNLFNKGLEYNNPMLSGKRLGIDFLKKYELWSE